VEVAVGEVGWFGLAGEVGSEEVGDGGAVEVDDG
jgi:hypothetical protein